MKHGPCVDKVKSDNTFLTAPTPSENLIQKPVLERLSLAFYSRIGLIRARERFELSFHLHTRFMLRPNHGYQTYGNYLRHSRPEIQPKMTMTRITRITSIQF